MPEIVKDDPTENPFASQVQVGAATKSFNPFKQQEEETKEFTPGGNTSFGNQTKQKADLVMFTEVTDQLKKPKRNTTPSKHPNHS